MILIVLVNQRPKTRHSGQEMTEFLDEAGADWGHFHYDFVVVSNS